MENNQYNFEVYGEKFIQNKFENGHIYNFDDSLPWKEFVCEICKVKKRYSFILTEDLIHVKEFYIHLETELYLPNSFNLNLVKHYFSKDLVRDYFYKDTSCEEIRNMMTIKEIIE
jgi:hypothetical protein